MNIEIAARAPNHLGDAVMSLPSMHALAQAGDLVIHGPSWSNVVFRDVNARVASTDVRLKGDCAVLFPPSFRVAWEARGVARRIGVASDWRRWLLTDVVKPGLHRTETYRHLAHAAGGRVCGPPVWRVRDDDPVVDVPNGHIGLNPVSVSGAVREWRGFRDLADRVAHEGRVPVFYGGPGEEERIRAIAGPHLCKVGLPLPAFANAIGKCQLFVSNDSGAAHFAAAAGTKVLVIYGSTFAARTGPIGALGVEGPDLDCRPCYKQKCRNNLECYATDVVDVLGRVRTEVGG